MTDDPVRSLRARIASLMRMMVAMVSNYSDSTGALVVIGCDYDVEIGDFYFLVKTVLFC